MKKKKNVLKEGMTPKEWKEFNKQHRKPPIPPQHPLGKTKRSALDRANNKHKGQKNDEL